MKKSLLIVSIITILLISISIPVFAMDNVANGVRNFVGDTENVIENAGSSAANGIKNGLNKVSEGTQNMMSDTRNGMQNTENSVVGTMTTDNNNSGYTATRTTTDDVRLAGMTTDTWSWIVVAITVVAIGILIWSYMRQRNKNDLYIDSDDDE